VGGYVFHCSSCGFDHAGDCSKIKPLPLDDQQAMEEAIKEATLDELKAAYLVIKKELIDRLSKQAWP
jgi:hypothetical protein